LIYDVGAHEGEDTAFYLKKGFRVVAVECNPKLVARLTERFRNEAADGRFTLVNAAIAEAPGEIEFFVNDAMSVWSTADPELAARNARLGAPSQSVKVEARRFDSVLAEHGIPYYLKVDIEGFDLMCIEGLRHVAGRPRYVSMESDQKSWSTLVHEFDVLRGLGYLKFQLVCQGTVPQQLAPTQALEGLDVEHAFAHGSAGLFGKELPGQWLTREEALRRYRRIFIKYKLFGHNTLGEALLRHIDLGNLKYRLLPSWWDTHATF